MDEIVDKNILIEKCNTKKMSSMFIGLEEFIFQCTSNHSDSQN